MPRNKKRLSLILGGMAGAGKSSAADLLAERFGMKRVSAGSITRTFAKKKGMDLITFGLYLEKHPAFDRKLDLYLVDEARKGGRIIDSRTTAYLARKRGVPALRVFLAVDPIISAKRVAKRDGISVAKALRDSRVRERDIARRLKRLFGLDTSDPSQYDVVIRTDDYTNQEVVELISALLKYGT